MVRAECIQHGQWAIFEFRRQPIPREWCAAFLDRRDVRRMELGKKRAQLREAIEVWASQFRLRSVRRAAFGKSVQCVHRGDASRSGVDRVRLPALRCAQRAVLVSPPCRYAASWTHVKRLNLLPDGADHRLTVAVDIGEHHDPLSELFAFETFPYYVERRLLLADYEQRLSAAE